MNGPKVVCLACEQVEVSIAVPVCTDCLNKMVAAREHVPFGWCWCNPRRDLNEPEVVIHQDSMNDFDSVTDNEKSMCREYLRRGRLVAFITADAIKMGMYPGEANWGTYFKAVKEKAGNE